MKKVTVKDIAQASGYSISTVSKALHNTDRVGAQTIQKIRQIADEMGYHPGLAAQALAGKRRRVALVLKSDPPEICWLFRKGFEEAFAIYEELGFSPEYYFYHQQQGMETLPWEQIKSRCLAAVVIPGVGCDQVASQLAELHRAMPLVMLQSLPPEELNIPRLCDVTVQAEVVGQLAAEFLSVCVPGATTAAMPAVEDSWLHQQNLLGYQRGAAANGLNDVGAVYSRDEKDIAYEQTEKLLDRFPELGGIFVSSYVTPAVCRCIREHHRQVAVVGMDLFADTVEHLMDGSLSAAIFQDQPQQARLAVETAIQALRQQSVARQILVKPELVLRANLSCYPKF